MAQAKTIRFAGQLLMLGNGATPTEVFTAPCGLTSLNLTVNIETNSTNVPDCADPDLPAWLESDEVSKQMVVGVSGVIDTDAMQVWREWLPTGGVCDGNNIAACGVSVVDTMGVRGGAIHSADEFLIVDSLVERARLSALAIARLASGEGQS